MISLSGAADHQLGRAFGIAIAAAAVAAAGSYHSPHEFGHRFAAAYAVAAGMAVVGIATTAVLPRRRGGPEGRGHTGARTASTPLSSSIDSRKIPGRSG